MTTFLKMHGLGNDFVIFDARIFPLPLDPITAKAISDRKRGIGCDQVIVMEPAKNGAAAFMRIFNADGGEVESCGNAARCVAYLLMAERESDHIALETSGGPLFCQSAGVDAVTVDMGPPRLDWREIPMAQAVDTEGFSLPVPGSMRRACNRPPGRLDGQSPLRAVRNGCGGGPRGAAWSGDRTPSLVSLAHQCRIRRAQKRFLSAHARLGAGRRHHARLRHGACAAVVAANLRGLTARKVKLILDGGELEIEWREADDHVLMTGPVAFSFAGRGESADTDGGFMSGVEIVTFGCRLNAYESEVIRARAAEAGLEDAVIVNTCAVTGEAVRQSRQAIRKLRRENPKARSSSPAARRKYSPRPMPPCRKWIARAGNQGKAGRRKLRRRFPGKRRTSPSTTSWRSRKRRRNSSTISRIVRAPCCRCKNGCDHRCTFCIIPYGRGNSRSVGAGAVVEEARRLERAKTNEIVLTGVDLTAYGADLPAPTGR